MNAVEAVLAEEIVMVGVKFASTKKVYHYKTLDNSIKLGDKLVVRVDDREKIVTVVELCTIYDVDDIEYKWIMAKIDTTLYDQAVAKEKEILAECKRAEAKKKREELMAVYKEHKALGTEE